MFKVLRNLSKSWISVVVIILLLIVQATADLNLPDYTSKIVNIGIQQGGIENAAPEVIRKSTMDDVLLFAEDDEEILADYTLISKENLEEKDYENYVKDYPALENEELYVRNSLKEEEEEALSAKMAKPLMIVQNLTTGETAETVKENILSQMPVPVKNANKDATALELVKLMFSMQTSTESNQMLEELMAKVNTMSESMVEQAAITAVKAEYQAVGINTDNYQNNYIWWTGLQMLGVAFVSMAAAVCIMFLSSRVAAKLGETLRDKIFKKVLGFSTSEFKQFSTASLITRSTNDIQQIQMLITMLFRVVVYAPIIGIGGFFKVLATSDNSMAWIIGVAVGSIILIVAILFGIAMPRFKKLQDLIDKLNLVSREMLTGLSVIRAFHTEKREEKRFDDANKNLMKTYMFVNKAMNLMMPILMLVMNSISLLTIYAGRRYYGFLTIHHANSNGILNDIYYLYYVT